LGAGFFFFGGKKKTKKKKPPPGLGKNHGGVFNGFWFNGKNTAEIRRETKRMPRGFLNGGKQKYSLFSRQTGRGGGVSPPPPHPGKPGGAPPK